MNSALLKGFIAAHGETQGDLAKALGISASNLSDKINGKSASFRQSEIGMIKARYQMTAEDVDAVFFNLNLS